MFSSFATTLLVVVVVVLLLPLFKIYNLSLLMYDLPTYINIAYILHMYLCMCVYRFNQLPPRVCVFSQLLTALSPSIPLF